jgi:hypothetical protein
MPFADALELVDDDLPDGAYFALAHEIAGLDYGDGFDEIEPPRKKGAIKCLTCGRKFGDEHSARQHTNMKHGGEQNWTVRR